MDSRPLVSIICLCYNQADFVQLAIESILDQDYPAIEIIVIDDASTDYSVSVIEEIVAKFPNIIFIKNNRNLGNCKSFNKGLNVSKGKYLIDLAADDVLMPDRVTIGVADLESKDSIYAIQYGAVDLINENGKLIGKFYDQNPTKPFSGDLYKLLIERFFISAPSMMMSRSVLEELGGYDEDLAYEDFDFWIRSSRDHLYSFTNQTVVKKRIHAANFSKKQSQFRNKLSRSTYLICEKIFHLNKDESEHQALARRVTYEIRKNLQYGNFRVSLQFYYLLKKVKKKIRGTHETLIHKTVI